MSLPGSPVPLFKIKVQEKGKIKDIKEIVVRVEGLPTCLNGQIVDMGQGVKGIIMGYNEDDVLVLVLGDQNKLRMGKEVTGVSEPFRIPVGDGFVGRMVTALGNPCDQGDPVEASDFYPVFRESARITCRAPVSDFLPTGTKVIDCLVPLAKGQRQLILGDRMTGKTTIALDAILNQANRDMICIYCCIGKSITSVEKVTAALHDSGALSYTVIIVATDSSPVGEQYLVPFSAASLADYFASRKRDVLVVFDDLTKHAWAYRQLSLLLERPPGREAYPGDIFYVQTQLMERAGNFNESYGGGSITYLGIAETLQGDLAGYIPSNLASMCDGQICMSAAIFAEGFRPAIDFSLSLSIIGGRVQPPLIKDLSRTLRSDFAHYKEVVNLSKLQSGLSGASEKIVRKGRAIMSMLQQGQNQPASQAEQAILLYALHKDHVVDVDAEGQERFRKTVFPYACANHRALVERIERGEKLTPEIEQGLEAIVKGFLESVSAGAA